MLKAIFPVLLCGGLMTAPVVSQADDAVLMQHPLSIVTKTELETAIDYLVPRDRQQVIRASDKGLRGFLADYFTIKMMAEEARKQKLDQSERVSFVVTNYENRLLAETLIQRYVDSAKRPDFEKLALETYKAEPELFLRPEQVKAEHILIAVNDERTEAQALSRAQEVYEKLKQSKSGFAALAKEYSDDPSVERNDGRLGFFSREKMVPEFSEAAFSLKKGGISEPVKTSFGYHVIHVLEHRAETKMPFDSVKAKLIKEEEDKFLAAKRQEFVSGFRESDQVVFDEEAMVDFVKAMEQSSRK